jgi:hypothetical protein
LECVTSAKSILSQRLSEFELVGAEIKEERCMEARSGGGFVGTAAANMLRNEEIAILNSAVQMVEKKGDKLWRNYYREF